MIALTLFIIGTITFTVRGLAHPKSEPDDGNQISSRRTNQASR
jgi:hypothetical protein